jgi:hypothetical protein
MSHHDEFNSRDDWPAVSKGKAPVKADPLDLPALLAEAERWLDDCITGVEERYRPSHYRIIRALRDALVQQHEALRIAQRFADAWRADAGQADAALAESREQLARVRLDRDAP